MRFSPTQEESIGSRQMRNIVTLTAVVALSTGCFEAQRAAGCNNVGILGCKDDPSAIEQPNPALQPAPLGGRHFPRSEPRSGPPESEGAAGEISDARRADGRGGELRDDGRRRARGRQRPRRGIGRVQSEGPESGDRGDQGRDPTRASGGARG